MLVVHHFSQTPNNTLLSQYVCASLCFHIGVAAIEFTAPLLQQDAEVQSRDGTPSASHCRPGILGQLQQSTPRPPFGW